MVEIVHFFAMSLISSLTRFRAPESNVVTYLRSPQCPNVRPSRPLLDRLALRAALARSGSCPRIFDHLVYNPHRTGRVISDVTPDGCPISEIGTGP